MSSFNVNFVKSLVSHIFPTLRKTQKVNLSLGIFGLAHGQSGLMSKIAREFTGERIYKHQLKRFFRFLSNPRVKPERLMEFWVRFCIPKFSCQKQVIVAMDWTTLPGNIQCLMLAIPCKGRAIPLLWQILPYSEIKDSQNRIEERLVAKLINLFPSDKQLILVADRGFGRASFIQFLLRKQVLFVVRVKSDVKVTPRRGSRTLLRVLGEVLKPGVPIWLPKISYRDDCAVSGVNLACVVAKESDDPWFLVTNLKSCSSAVKTYQQRFDIEEWFKDLKHQLGIADLQTKSLMRVRRILFVAAISYSILMLIGTLANHFPKMKSRGDSKRQTGLFSNLVSLRSYSPASPGKDVLAKSLGYGGVSIEQTNLNIPAQRQFECGKTFSGGNPLLQNPHQEFDEKQKSIGRFNLVG